MRVYEATSNDGEEFFRVVRWLYAADLGPATRVWGTETPMKLRVAIEADDPRLAPFAGQVGDASKWTVSPPLPPGEPGG